MTNRLGPYELNTIVTGDAINKKMELLRYWDMPNSNTFLIPTIRAILKEYVGNGLGWVDPFANSNSPAEITNDLNPEMPTAYHLDAVAFLQRFDSDSKEGVLLDPPYSFHQIVQCYKGYGTERIKAIAAAYNEAARIVRPGGYVLTFGWNSNGVGESRKFKTERVYLVAHGGSHNDTIVTVQRKMATQPPLFAIPEPEQIAMDLAA